MVLPSRRGGRAVNDLIGRISLSAAELCFPKSLALHRAGAEVVGGDDLISRILEAGSGGIDFDKCLATPDMMAKLGRIARVLGPRGLMPNPKLGTIVTDVTPAVKALKEGRVEFRCVGLTRDLSPKPSVPQCEKLHSEISRIAFFYCWRAGGAKI